VLVGEGAVAVAGFAIGIGYRAAAHAAQGRHDEAQARLIGQTCPSAQPTYAADCATLSSALDDRDRRTDISWAGFAVGGVGAAALIATWLIWKSSGEPPRTGIIVVPELNRQTRSLVVAWKF